MMTVRAQDRLSRSHAGGLLAIGLLLAACSKPVEVSIGTVGETMAYDKTAITVKSGQKVHLTLKNNAKGPTMSHNWVLVKPGTEAAVASAGQQVGEGGGFLPLSADVLAHTNQTPPGSSSDVTFTAPDPGTYPYICTNPGHFQTMKGTLTVTP